MTKKRKVWAEEGVFYKVNRAIIQDGKKFYVRNTFTGEETEIPRPVAMNIKLEWNKQDEDFPAESHKKHKLREMS